MPEGFIGHCKAALSNLISGDQLQQSEDPWKSFPEAILNHYSHYCLDVHSSPWCYHDKFNPDGTPYTTDQHFSCKAQAGDFKALLESMAARPQDYVSNRGRLTTNVVHGLALLYRD